MILVAEKATDIFCGIVPSPCANKTSGECTHRAFVSVLTTGTYARVTSELFSPPELAAAPGFT